MNISFAIIVYTGIVLAIVQACRIGVLFFKIGAKIKNRPYMGLPNEWVNINIAEWFKGRYFDIFPVSFFLRKLDPERYSAYSEEVQQMFRKKFKYEIYFWTVFLFGLLLIPVSQFLTNGWKYKEESETSSRILESLLKKDTSAIFNRIGNNHILKDSESIIFKMTLASMLIEKYGIPQKGRFTFKAYPERDYKNVDILVPLTNSNIDDIETPVISFEFAKYLGSDKIENFSVRIGLQDDKFKVPSNKFYKYFFLKR